MGEEFIFQAGTPALLVKLHSFHYQPRSFFLFKHAAEEWDGAKGGCPSLLERALVSASAHPLSGGTPAHPEALAHGSSTQAPLPTHVTHDKGDRLRSKTCCRPLQKQHKLLILSFCLWNKVKGIEFGNLIKFECFIELWWSS